MTIEAKECTWILHQWAFEYFNHISELSDGISYPILLNRSGGGFEYTAYSNG